MKPSDPNDETLHRLVKLMAEEAMAMPADELLAQAKNSHPDVKAHVETLRTAMERRIAAVKKGRLSLARRAVDAEQASTRAKLLLPLAELKAKVRALMDTRTDIPERLTLAFRSGSDLTDDDWESIAQDLADLGFMDDSDKQV